MGSHNLEAFFKKSPVSIAAASFTEKPRTRKRKLSALQEYESLGRMPGRLRRQLVCRNIAGYSQVWSTDGTANSLFRRQGAPALSSVHISSLEFDSEGKHLVSASTAGWLSVYKLKCSIPTGSLAESSELVHSVSLQHNLEAATWNPTKSNEVGCVADGVNTVFCVDMEAGRREVLSVREDGWADKGRAGLYDLTFSAHSRFRLLAGGRGGRVLLWDRRRSISQSSSTAAAHPAFGALHGLQLSEDEQVVYAGTESGVVQAWDLRGGRLSTAFCSANQAYHPPLTTFCIYKLLAEVPLLQEQADVRPSAVHSLLFDPSVQNRLGFHLNNGWSGTLDIGAMSLTHIHCPPIPWSAQEDEQAMRSRPWARVSKRRAAWLAVDSIFCVPSPTTLGVDLLDFGAAVHSKLSLQTARPPQETDEVSSPAIVCSKAVVCIASHPAADALVAGAEDNSVLLLSNCSGVKE